MQVRFDFQGSNSTARICLCHGALLEGLLFPLQFDTAERGENELRESRAPECAPPV